MAWWQRWDHCPCGGYATYANAVVLRDEQRSVCPQATEQLHASKCRFTAFPRVASWTRKPPTEWDLTVLWVMRIWALPQAIMDCSIKRSSASCYPLQFVCNQTKRGNWSSCRFCVIQFVSSFAFFAIFSSALLVTFYYHMRLSFVGAIFSSALLVTFYYPLRLSFVTACIAVGIQ